VFRRSAVEYSDDYRHNEMMTGIFSFLRATVTETSPLSELARNIRLAAQVACFAWIACAAHAFAQTPTTAIAPLSAAALFRNADVLRPTLSPNGAHMAVLARRSDKRDRLNIAVINLDTNRSVFVTPFDDSDVVEMHWVNSNRLIFTTGNILDAAGNTVPWRQGGMFAIDRDGQNARRLVSPLGTGDAIVLRPRYAIFLQAVSDTSDEVVVATNDNNIEALDVYRMNTRTARKTLLSFESPGDSRNWVLDKNGIPRGTMTQTRTRTASYWRAGENSKWQRLWEGEFTEQGSAVAGIDYDGSLIVSTYQGARTLPTTSGGLFVNSVSSNNPALRDTGGLARADPQTGQLREWIFAHARVDHGDLVFDPIKKKLVGVRYIDERGQTHWLDESWRNIQRAIDQALPGNVNYFTPPQQSKRMLVVSASTKHPGSVYEYDFASRKLKFLFDFRSGNPSESMAETRFARFPARDRTPLAALMTQPLGVTANRPAPTVVIVPGGPWAQAPCLCFDAEAQYFAQRGFAVIVPIYRGQLGLGHRHWVGGNKQWGLAMQDDVADAVDYAVKQGIADPARIAIMGASYGGYAALQGAAKTPSLYKAAIAMASPTDLQLFQSITWADYSDTAFQKHIAPVLIGDESRDAEQLRATSPVNNAASFAGPVLLAYGGEDRRIPQQHGTRMRDALERVNKQVEWLYKADEGHGFTLLENRIEYYSRAEALIRRAFGMR
jgi:dipeptidyl aminopeptidase/acylaminoacyl peptidase